MFSINAQTSVSPSDATATAPTGAAFSLVEVMVAIGMVGLLCFALLSGITFGYSVVSQERENRRATQVLLDKLEQVRLYNWSQIITNGLPTNFAAPFCPTTNGANTGFTYTGALSVASAPITESYASCLRLITVQVSWSSAGVAHQRSMSTLMSSNGLYNYIY